VNAILKPRDRAFRLRNAAAEVLSEIYKYRARVGEYHEEDTNALSVHLGLDQQGRSLSDRFGSPRSSCQVSVCDRATGFAHSMRGVRMPQVGEDIVVPAKEIFKRKLTSINASVVSFLTTDACTALPQFTASDVRYCEDRLYKGKAAKASSLDWWRLFFVGSRPAFLLDSLSEVDGSLDDAADDGITHFTGEDYINFRLQRYIDRFAGKAPWKSKQFFWMQTFIFFSVGVAGALSVMHQTIWMPVAITAALVATSNMGSMNLELQGRRTEVALAGLQEHLVWWQSLTSASRRRRANVQDLILSVEQVLLQEDANFLGTFERAHAAKGGGEASKLQEGFLEDTERRPLTRGYNP